MQKDQLDQVLDLMKEQSKEILILKNKIDILSVCLEYMIRLTSSQIEEIAGNRKYSEDKETIIKYCLLFGRKNQ